MDINETGKKSFLILDLNSLDISEKMIETDYIFFNEILIALPTSNEFDYIKNKITDLISKWNLGKDEIRFPNWFAILFRSSNKSAPPA